eukprot:1579075-Pyramimonas_sp.AAC.1
MSKPALKSSSSLSATRRRILRLRAMPGSIDSPRNTTCGFTARHRAMAYAQNPAGTSEHTSHLYI